MTALMIAAQLVGASLAATDFGAEEYQVNDDCLQSKTMIVVFNTVGP